ncbi:hypothetical protein [Arenimonas sp.]|uniref:hypothetical protein n=1 Tax=Arenimonas sp. TaxID=1872635 RepID=UPI0039E2A72A
MNRNLSLLALALAAALPFTAANATDLKYNYVQGGYSAADIGGLDMDGYGVKGSVAFGDKFYGLASYDRVSDNGIDLSETAVGVGFRHGLSDKTDFFTEASFVQDDLDVVGSDNGYRVAGGVRSLMSDKFEGSVKATYTDVGDYGNGFGAGVSGLFHISNTWGVYASYDYADRDSNHFNTWGAGVRASF